MTCGYYNNRTSWCLRPQYNDIWGLCCYHLHRVVDQLFLGRNNIECR